MLSYKQWKLLNESLGGAIPLGVSQPQTIGAVGSNLSLYELDQELQEAKKKMVMKAKKKMGGECPSDDDDDDDDDKDMDMDIKGKDVGSDDDSGNGGPDMGSEDDDMDSDEDDDGGDMMMKRCSKKKAKKCSKKQMKKEHSMKEYNPNETEEEFFASLQSQLSGGVPTNKNWDGLSEDALYAMSDPNQGLADMNPQISGNPQAGEVGYAPDTRVATQFGESSNVDSYFQNIVEDLVQDGSIPESVRRKILSKLQ